MNGEAKMNKAEEAARDAALERVKREVPVENGGGGLDEVTRDMACVIGWNAAIAYAKRERQWVPIHGEDDLPEGDSEFVLVQWKSGAMSIYSFSFRDDPPSDYEYPVAYMPLPDPYQPKTDGADLTIKTLGQMTTTEIAALDWADVRRVLSGETGDKAEGEKRNV